MIVESDMVERVGYSVVSRSGDVEIRRYPKMAVATVSGMSDDGAFRLLFDYISGNNGTSQRVAMTAPVMSDARVFEKLPMTAPVVSSPGSFSFVMPAGRDAESLPTPKDERVSVVDIPERTVATLRFRGRTGDTQVATRATQLLGKLGSGGISVAGKPFLMRYNPPFIPGFLRRNEVGVEVTLSDKG